MFCQSQTRCPRRTPARGSPLIGEAAAAQVVREADGFQPHLVSPEYGLKRLVDETLALTLEPVSTCVRRVHQVLLDAARCAPPPSAPRARRRAPAAPAPVCHPCQCRAQRSQAPVTRRRAAHGRDTRARARQGGLAQGQPAGGHDGGGRPARAAQAAGV
jgi:hypothetical protein